MCEGASNLLRYLVNNCSDRASADRAEVRRVLGAFQERFFSSDADDDETYCTPCCKPTRNNAVAPVRDGVQQRRDPAAQLAPGAVARLEELTPSQRQTRCAIQLYLDDDHSLRETCCTTGCLGLCSSTLEQAWERIQKDERKGDPQFKVSLERLQGLVHTIRQKNAGSRRCIVAFIVIVPILVFFGVGYLVGKFVE